MSTGLLGPVLCGLVLCAAGCATYSVKMADLRPQLAEGRLAEALQTVEKETGKKDELLYHLERGLLLHYDDQWTASNESFAAAERLAEDLYTKSVSEGALSLLTNDASISYRARPYEMAMVPYYKALNYILLGRRDEAQVEARRASLLMSGYVGAVLKDLREQDRGDYERIMSDPFLLYWSGMLYEWDGQDNDAYIAYRNAAQTYESLSGLLEVEVPPSLAFDLRRTAGRLGFGAELEELRQACPLVFAPDVGDTSAGWEPGGEVVFLLEAGFVPQKAQVRFDFPVMSGRAETDAWAWEVADGLGDVDGLTSGRTIEYWVSVAAPELQDSVPGRIGGCRLEARRDPVTVEGRTATVKCANLARQARITFDAEKPSILFKTILRGMTKYLASHQAEKSGGKVLGVVTNLFGAAVESADTRSWLTLPEHIRIGRLSLPAGVYDLKVQVLDPAGQVIHQEVIDGVQVSAGDWTFLSRRVF